MSRVVLSIPGGNTLPVCRICRHEAALIVHPNGHRADPKYPYCAKCVNDAMERAELEPRR